MCSPPTSQDPLSKKWTKKEKWMSFIYYVNQKPNNDKSVDALDTRGELFLFQVSLQIFLFRSFSGTPLFFGK